MSALLEQARAAGIPMRSWYAPRVTRTPEQLPMAVRSYIGWTTNADAAERLRDAGATIRPYTSADPRFSGFEIVIHETLPGDATDYTAANHGG